MRNLWKLWTNSGGVLPVAVAILVVVAIVAGQQPGAIGPEGPRGPRGFPGSPGADGTGGDGGAYSSLIVSSDEPPGANCPAGGELVKSGLDNGDGGGTSGDLVLQPGEQDLFFYVCAGADGAAGAAGADGYNTVAKVTAESPGANCPAGGQKYESGQDNGDGGGTARNGILEAGERDVGPIYICAGAAGATGSDGANGFDTIVKMTTESPGANCPAGGQKYESGLDNGDGGGTARNGILEAGERDVGPIYICAGADGATSLMKQTAESAGANCPNGGWKGESGLDNGDGGGTANNGVLEAGAVDAGPSYACDGADGAGVTVAALANAFTSTSTTGAEVTSLTIAIGATGTYRFEYTLIAQTAAVGTGIDFGVNYDSTQSIIVATMYYQDTGTTATTGVADGTVTADGGELIIAGSSTITETTTAPNLNVITGVASANENFLVRIEGIVVVTATGNMELWCATDVAASQVTIGAGSALVLIKVA
jgi:hypothetical protein